MSTITAAPPSYNVVLMEEELLLGGGDFKKEIAEEVSTNVDNSLEKEHQVNSAQGKFPVGFPENHYVVWTVMRVALMTVGIPIGCRRSRNIRCHGHGGQCRQYEQDRLCRVKKSFRIGGDCHSGPYGERRRHGCCGSRAKRY